MRKLSLIIIALAIYAQACFAAGGSFVFQKKVDYSAVQQYLHVSGAEVYQDPWAISAVKFSFDTEDPQIPTFFATDIGYSRVTYAYPTASYVLGVRTIGGDVKSFGGYGSGNGQFNCPRGIAAYKDGNVYVADSKNDRIVKLRYQGESLVFVKNIGNRGSGAGQFRFPQGLAVDYDGNVYVADSGNHRIQKLDPNGNPVNSFNGKNWIGGIGKEPGKMFAPQAVAVDSQGIIYVCDTGNKRIQKFNAYGDPGKSVTGNDLGLANPYFVSIAVGSYYDNVYIVDQRNNQLLKLNKDLFLLDKLGGLTSPRGVAVYDPYGEIFIAEGPGGQYYDVGVEIKDLKVAPAEIAPMSSAPFAEIAFVLTETAKVSVEVFDSADNLIASLAGGLDRWPGKQVFTWNGYNQANYSFVSPGTYKIQVKAACDRGSQNTASAQTKIKVLAPPLFRFYDVTSGTNIDNSASSEGIAAGDIDNDGRLEALIGRDPNDNNSKIKVYKLGSNFIDITPQTGIDPSKKITSPVFVDINNDGSLDIISDGGIWQNDGKGHFKEITGDCGINNLGGPAAADVDKDGKLDLFFAGISALYRNIGNSGDDNHPRFIDATPDCIKAIGKTKGGIFADMDNDMSPDLLILDDQGKVHVFQNKSGTSEISFIDVTESCGVAVNKTMNSAVFGDLFNRAKLDLILAGNSTSAEGQTVDAQSYKLFGNESSPGNIRFADVTITAGITESANCANGAQVLVGDFNSDCKQDVFILNPGISDSQKGKRFYKNNGDGTFVGINDDITFPNYLPKYGAIAADYSGDLRPDLILIGEQNNKVYLNGESNNNIKIKLRSRVSNSSCIGAKLKLYKNGHLGDPSFLIGYREVSAYNIACSSPPLDSIMALGKDSSAVLEVVFPSGLTLTREVHAGNEKTIYEDNTAPIPFNIISPTGESYTSSGSVEVSWEASDDPESGLQGYLIFLNGFSTAVSADACSHIFPNLADGEYIIKVRAINNNGDWRDSTGQSNLGNLADDSKIVKVIVDTTPPAMFSPVSPLDGKIFATSEVSFLWSPSSDNNFAYYAVSVGTIEPDLTTIATFPADAVSGEVNLSEGEYFYDIVAFDKVLNHRSVKDILSQSMPTGEAVSNLLKFKVDYTPPSILNIAAIPAIFTPNGDGINDTACISFNLSEKAKTYIKIKDNSGNVYKTLFSQDQGPGECKFTWDGLSNNLELKSGKYTFTIWAEDPAGNRSPEYDGGSITIDVAPYVIMVKASPEVMSNAVANPVPISLMFTLSDGCSVDAGIYSGSNKIKDLISNEYFDRGSHRILWDGKNDGGRSLDQGNYSYIFKAYAGSFSEEKTGVVRIDNSPPVISSLKIAPDIVSKQSLENETVSFDLTHQISERSYISMDIVDSSGAFISNISSKQFYEAGRQAISFDGSKLKINNSFLPGSYSIKITAVDEAGNASENTDCKIKIIEGIQVTGIYAKPSLITPNGDGFDDMARIGWYISGGAGDLTATLKILGPSGATVKTLLDNTPVTSGTGSEYWTGDNDTGGNAPDNPYTYQIVVRDSYGNSSAPATGDINLIRSPTAIVRVAPSTFSPNGDGQDDYTNIYYDIVYPQNLISGKTYINIDIYDSSDKKVYSYSDSRDQGAYVLAWDGKDNQSNPGSIVPDGIYTVITHVEDPAGTKYNYVDGVNVDTTGPKITFANLSENIITPNGDGIADSTTFIYSATDEVSSISNIIINIYDSQTRFDPSTLVKTLKGSETGGTVWDGTVDVRGGNGDIDANGYADRGLYSFVIEAKDSEGNIAAFTGPAPIRVDSMILNIDKPPGNDPFPSIISPNGDGITDKSVVFFSLSVSGETGASYAQSLARKGIFAAGINQVDYYSGNVTVKVKDSSGSTAATLCSGMQCYKDTMYCVTWEGIDERTGFAAVEGSYTIEVTAVDMIGDPAANSLISGVTPGFDNIIVDLTPPTAEVTSPAEYSWQRGAFQIFGTINDENPGTYSLGYGGSTDNIGSGTGNKLNESLVTWDTTGLNNDYIVKLRACDAAGNTCEAHREINIDNTSPYVINLTSEVNGAGRSNFNPYTDGFIKVKFDINENSFDDSVYSIPAPYVYVTAEIWSDSALVKQLLNNAPLTNTTNSVTWDGQNADGDYVNEGTYILKIWARDTAGNLINFPAIYSVILADDQLIAGSTEYPKILCKNGKIYTTTISGGEGIIYKCSTDEGKTWSHKVIDSAQKMRTRVSLGVEGDNVHIIYYDWATGNGNYYVRSFDNGQTWSDKLLLAADQMWVSHVGYPAICAQGNNVYAAWERFYGMSTQGIYFRHSGDNGVSWSGETKIIESGSDPSLFSVGDQLILIYNGNRLVRSTDNGTTWSTPETFPTDVGGSIAVYGNCIYTFQGSKFSKSIDIGHTWNTFDLGITNYLENPVISAHDNIINVAYISYPNPDRKLHYKRSIDYGQIWSDNIKISEVNNYINSTGIASIGNNAYVVFGTLSSFYFQKIPYNFAPAKIPGMAGFGILSIPKINQEIVIMSTSSTIELISPLNGTTVKTLRPTFKWYGVQNIKDYRIECATASDEASLSGTLDYFTTTISDVSSSRPVCEYIVPEHSMGLDESDASHPLWYWRVKTVNTTEASTSEVGAFKIDLPVSLSGVTNWPNPFNPNKERTKIRYRLGRQADSVTIRIYDITGRLVRELDGTCNAEGADIWHKYNDVEWDGRNGRGDMVLNGVYPFEVSVSYGNKTVTGRGKAVVLK